MAIWTRDIQNSFLLEIHIKLPQSVTKCILDHPDQRLDNSGGQSQVVPSSNQQFSLWMIWGDPKNCNDSEKKGSTFFLELYILLHIYAPISFCKWLHGVEWGLSLYSLKPSHHVFCGPHWGTIIWTFHWPSSGSARITTLWATIVVTWNPGIFRRSCCVGTFKTSRFWELSCFLLLALG